MSQDTRPQQCSIPDCTRSTKYRGFCSTHYARLRRIGDSRCARKSRRQPPMPTGCSVEGCDKPYNARGLCLMHYNRLRRTGDPLGVRKHGMPKTFCSIEDCGRPCYGHGFCDKHWRRWRKYGDPLRTPLRMRVPQGTLAERLWAHIVKRGPDDCWLWHGCMTSTGYGCITSNGKGVTAHRVAWELVHGPMPKDKMACHSCEGRYPPGDITSRRCCNPAHTYPGSAADNRQDRVRSGRDPKHYHRRLVQSS